MAWSLRLSLEALLLCLVLAGWSSRNNKNNDDANNNSKNGCEKSLQVQLSVRTHLAKLTDLIEI